MQKIYIAVRVVSWEKGGVIDTGVLGSSVDLSVANRMIEDHILYEKTHGEITYHSECSLDSDGCLRAVLEKNSFGLQKEHIFINYETVVSYVDDPNNIYAPSK